MFAFLFCLTLSGKPRRGGNTVISPLKLVDPFFMTIEIPGINFMNTLRRCPGYSNDVCEKLKYFMNWNDFEQAIDDTISCISLGSTGGGYRMSNKNTNIFSCITIIPVEMKSNGNFVIQFVGIIQPRNAATKMKMICDNYNLKLIEKRSPLLYQAFLDSTYFRD